MDRTCFNCQHFLLCYLRIRIDEAMRFAKINIDGDDAPGKWLDMFSTLASICLHFNFKKEE